LCLFSFKSLAQSLVSSKILPDTSKLDNFSYYLKKQKEIKEKRLDYYPSDEEVKSWYYDSEQIKNENGKIELYRNFNKYKRVSYPVKNVDIFNKALPKAEMLFEYCLTDVWSGWYRQRLIAKYDGKYYFFHNINQLLDNLDANSYLTVEEKIQLMYKWVFWLEDANFEIISLEKIKEIYPGDFASYRKVPTDSGRVETPMYYVEYQAFYEGLAIYKGDTVKVLPSVIGNNKHLKSCIVDSVLHKSCSHNFQKVSKRQNN